MLLLYLSLVKATVTEEYRWVCSNLELFKLLRVIAVKSILAAQLIAEIGIFFFFFPPYVLYCTAVLK